MTSARPLPAPRVAPRHLRADGTTRPAPVPPAWFRTTSTAFSALKFAGLLRPAAGHEVRRVSQKPAPATPNAEPPRWFAVRGRGETGLAPRDANDPSKSSPRSQPYRVTTACPSVPSGLNRVVALPASRCRSAEVVRSESDPRLRGVAPRTSPLRPTPFRAPVRSFLPWACSLFVVRLPPQPPWTFQGRPETPEGEPSGRPSHGGDTPGWSRGHPSHAVRPKPPREYVRRGRSPGITSAQARWGRPDRPP
jgi:hypothetical protein